MSLAAFDALPETERGLWVARHERGRETCGRCGLLRSVCGDEHRSFFPQRTVCYATMEQQAAQAKWERLHQDRPWHDGTFTNWSKDPSDSHPYHHAHGVTIWVAETDLNPDDNFLGSAASQQIAGEHEQPDQGE